jgi:positive regulator of sigma E activity
MTRQAVVTEIQGTAVRVTCSTGRCLVCGSRQGSGINSDSGNGAGGTGHHPHNRSACTSRRGSFLCRNSSGKSVVPGDRVILRTSAGDLLADLFLVMGVPLVFGIGGYIGAAAAGASLGFQWSLAAVCAVFGTGICMLWNRIRGNATWPEIIEKVEQPVPDPVDETADSVSTGG